jgi:hypothetical protein
VVGAGGFPDAAEEPVELDEFVVGEVDGAGEAFGEVGEPGAEFAGLGGGVDPDGAFVVGAAFAADESLGFEAFEQG